MATSPSPTAATLPVYARGCLSCGHEMSVYLASCDHCGSRGMTQPVRAELLIEALRREGFTELPVF